MSKNNLVVKRTVMIHFQKKNFTYSSICCLSLLYNLSCLFVALYWFHKLNIETLLVVIIYVVSFCLFYILSRSLFSTIFYTSNQDIIIILTIVYPGWYNYLYNIKLELMLCNWKVKFSNFLYCCIYHIRRPARSCIVIYTISDDPPARI